MKQRQVNLLILFFGLGVLAGWLLRDQFRPKGSESHLATDVVNLDSRLEIDSLIRDLNEGLFAKSVRTAEHLLQRGDHGSGEINQLINTTASRLIRHGQYLQAKNLLERYYAKFNTGLQGLIILARSLAGTEEYWQQIATLLQAQLLADTPVEEERISSLLKKAVDGYSEVLVAENRWGDLDLFYQQLISKQPENPHHYLQLALLRMRVGDPDGALDPLSRIENDPLLGEQVQQMMAKIQRNSELVATRAEVPLVVRGSRYGLQYIVKARLDNYRDLNLLIDTGAVITVIEPRLLAELGYDLDGEVQYFSTANGTIQAPMVELQDLSIGSVAVKELSVAAVNLSMAGEIDGLLGMNFLRHYQFRIDQHGKVLHLDPIAR